MPEVVKSPQANMPIQGNVFKIQTFTTQSDMKEHVALYLGKIDEQPAPLVRIHSECLTGDVFGSQRCDCGPQLDAAMAEVIKEGRGLILYLRQEGRGIGLAEKIKAYKLQDEGYDTVDANLALGHAEDEREYSVVPKILESLGVSSIRLMTNNPLKVEACRSYSINVQERVPVPLHISAQNQDYLRTKSQKMRHMFDLPSSKKKD